MKTLLLITLLFASSIAQATVCAQDDNSFFNSMEEHRQEIVQSFMHEKLDVPAEDIIEVNFTGTRKQPRIRDVLVIGTFTVLELIIKDECGIIPINSLAGKGVFKIAFFNQERQRCETELKVKGGVGLLDDDQYKITPTHSDKKLKCE